MNAVFSAQLRHIQAARTLDDMLSAVTVLRDMDSLAAIPPLAALDRRATGWFQIRISWLIALLEMAARVLAVLCVCWLVLFAIGLTLVRLIYPDMGAASTLLLVCGAFVIAGLLGRAFIGSNLFLVPRLRLQAETQRLATHAELRRQLRHAAQAYRRRNQAAVGADWRRAVCRRCLARCELCAVRLAYGRRLNFARCRICHDDAACASGIRTIEGLIGAAGPAGLEQSSTLLRVDLTPYLSANDRVLPWDLDRIVIGRASDRLVEVFLVRYQEQGARRPMPAIRWLGYHILPHSTITENTRRMLDASLDAGRFGGGRAPFKNILS